MWNKLKNALIKIWFTEEGYKQFQREMQDIKQGTEHTEHKGRKKRVKPKVEKIILFWLDNVPERKDAQAIADLLPQQMHPELDFETTHAVNDKISGESVLKLMDKLIITISSRLSAAVIKDNAHIKKEEFTEITKIRAMNIAVMQIILKKLKSKYGFDYAKFPNRLICKFVEATTGLCYYALILDLDIDPSNYDFATGKGGAKLSTIFWEANTAPE